MRMKEGQTEHTFDVGSLAEIFIVDLVHTKHVASQDGVVSEGGRTHTTLVRLFTWKKNKST